ncbi:pyridoxine 5'-phosphate synthase [Coxiella endosymbiont of Amblyomma americanum]|uniref:pyridoxine 5'-phosphate synthase n=1 Tax=Coxiella endosymbiont of Amblyomma americanum TaxID=325775 RepID=UPI00057D72D2|nr:pyridoxine 5'-phosphate synthase [Coxiella endosymbiont of Amblyomma americanum]AJC50254.1 pyridoxine 5'-phosphate synthase [Coxiella endosymbiont of Amblyomma americanum]AUJ58612.1 pyridoxine 5'-phosphate synthase [Coxiella-like endosymbiont of Amblyomma americanum]
MVRLGVNIDHVATLRQARKTNYPDPAEAALVAVKSGADTITLHLREDRRHIQDNDVCNLKQKLDAMMIPLNLEMAVNQSIVQFAKKIKPRYCCLVPEQREELTTEGGLDVVSQKKRIKAICSHFADIGITMSLFIDAVVEQIDAAKDCGVTTIEIHTGHYADAKNDYTRKKELKRITFMANYAYNLGLSVNAGHGLTIHNIQPIAAIPIINELNIGHSIISRAIFVGLSLAVKEIKMLILKAR